MYESKSGCEGAGAEGMLVTVSESESDINIGRRVVLFCLSRTGIRDNK